MTEQDQAPPSRLRWRCRRGMRELDVLLEGWLKGRWQEADESLRDAFADLLECEDDVIWDWVTGRDRPAGERMRKLIDELRARTGFGHSG
ncbi:MAG: succinate dehydrogenase assembly factor 2 [Wenzhouxiangella sp.]